MSFVRSVFVVAVACLAVAVAQTDRRAIIDYVNNLEGNTWVAGENSRFENVDDAGIRRLLGVLPREKKLDVMTFEEPAAIPTDFDSRTQWGSICPSVNEVRDQSDCGSCWAFGAAEAATDRICIATNGASKPHLATTDLLSCCTSCGSGCDGGYPDAAWDWFKTTGVVTGGQYGDFSWCRSYPFPKCDHHVNGTYGPCPADEYPTPKCLHECDKNTTYTTPFASDKHKFKTAYSVGSSVSQIQTDIMTNGPVEGAFTVYSDFPMYKSGVYRHTTGSALGGHAVKLIGWGVEAGTNYWWVANSWNTEWGNGGFFKILRGHDECGIESSIVAGLFK